MRLTRYEYGESATFGKLHLPDGSVLETLEPPWLDNEPFVSCVPDGTYQLVHHDSSKYPDTWALTGETVSHFESPGFARYTCVFHAGNFPRETVGCILVAEDRYGEQLTATSRAAMEQLRLAMMAEELLPDLTIVNISGSEGTAMTEATDAPLPVVTTVTNAEENPSPPERGAARDLARTIGGWVISLVMLGLAKVGLDFEIPPDMLAGLAVGIGSFIVSPVLAWLGKLNRQSESPTTVLGNLF